MVGEIDVLTSFLLVVALILLCCHVLGSLLGRLRQPPVIGEILGGLLLGPSVLGAMWPSGHAALFPPGVLGALDLMAQLGLVVFVFLLGTEVRVEKLGLAGARVLGVLAGSMLLPFVAGVVVAPLVRERFAAPGAPATAYALFVGLAMSITALPVLARILTDLRLEGSPLGSLALTSAAFGDAVAWLVLIPILSAAGVGGADGGVLPLVLAVGLVVVAVTCVRPGLAVAVRFASRTDGGRRLLGPLLLAGAVAFASTAHVVGMHPLIGAFLFGLLVPRDALSAAGISAQLRGFTMWVLLPMFFADVGSDVSVGVLVGDATNWLLFLGVLAVAILPKFAGVLAGAYRTDLAQREKLALATLMNCRGVTELVMLSIGLHHGLISTTAFSVLVLVALVTTAMTSPAVQALLRERTGHPVHTR